MEYNKVSTLKIHKLSQDQYNALEENNQVDNLAIYLTPNSLTGIDGATLENIEAAMSELANVPAHIEQLSKDLETKADTDDLDTKADAENVAYIYGYDDDEDVSDDMELNVNIQAAVNNALAQAKELGIFDGEKGEKGEDGDDGTSITHSWDGTVLTITSASGSTSVDLKGKDGENGSNGSNGTPATHSWNGTVLTIESASGTSSADLKGEKGDNGDDYVLTDADKTEIAQATKDLFDETLVNLTAIANGQCKSYVFDDEDDLDAALEEYNSGSMSEDNILYGKTLKTGDVFYLRAEGVADYWWDGDTNSKQILEVAEVPLENYALKGEIPTNLSQLGTDDSHLLVTKAEKEAWSAKSNFSGLYNELDGKPTSLPANGGNADTVGGYQIIVSDTAPKEDNPNIITIVI